MMEKLSQAGEGRGACPPPFNLFTITYKVAVYGPAERADTVHAPYFISTPIYSVVLATLRARALIAPVFLGKLTHDKILLFF
jgi:hypothetical protein